MFIKDVNGDLIGVMCINFDDSRYRELSQKVFNLCHPDSLVDTNFRFDESRVPAKMSEQPHRLKQAPDGSAHDIITAELKNRNLNPDLLSVNDKLNLLRELDSKGVFLIKGAVKDAAAIFGCSQATMYRHLSHIKGI
jgi:predicted transcriptional regulator YheO